MMFFFMVSLILGEVVNSKIDLSPLAGASLAVMDADSRTMRGNRPYAFAIMKTGQGLDEIIDFIEREGVLGG